MLQCRIMKHLITVIFFLTVLSIGILVFAQESGKDKPTAAVETVTGDEDTPLITIETVTGDEDKPMTTVETVKVNEITMTFPGSVTEATDVHFNNRYCDVCHDKKPKKGGNKFLKFNGDFTQLCRCHGFTPGTYIHPVDIEPSKEKKALIPKDLPLDENNRVSCLTCHDIYSQCSDNKRLKQLNRRFLRGAPYAKRTDLCFRCHDEKKYKMLDPHNQLTESGEIITEKCLYCHIEKPDEKKAGFQDVKLVGNLEILCQRCHGERDHPASANHLRKPSLKTAKIIEQGIKQYKIILPLNYDGKITCATCHNPHEKGVIPSDRVGSKGASSKFRHRLPGQMCLACHQM